MSYYNFGSEGFWKSLGCLALLGIIALGYLVVKGVIWMFNHVSIS